ncbi:SH3 domain protein [Taphrina deformans PYCC 5710]|uniref:SH3 domain protein n=1 Tax=Taphrina deformans (strain PYCC 5710 / ATCC 11124 / CBS 356.35 / IMI 108563 / JCM 9778 / NBRC 8474) TaxID=1097556 RepID=R4X7A8_TAPDE|nr:SH3 domain protein [Taphrina deformans PYCC 5710]|eukprot:CCG80958.1 SH3 domain protein [Taphrina deformans PYCC 5710]
MSETMRPPCDVKALYQYTSEHEDDLNFEVGQIIHVHAEEDDEWLNGSYINAKGDRETGIFPKSFVELVETPKAPARPSRTGAQKETHIGLDKETQLSNLTDTNPAETQGSEGLHTTSTKAETSTTDSAADVGARGPDSVEVASQFPVNETRTSSIRDATAHGEEDPQPKPAPVKYTSSVESAPQHTTEPPSTHEKVPKSNAFRDRIAAFNKQGAAPVAPKPMAKPSLAKKPFVAPPPSKDSYVPATTSKPKPTAIAPESHIDELAHGQVKLPQEIAHESTGPEAPPKVGSLKDRIAALQAERSHVAAKKAGAKEEGSSKAPVEPVSTQSGRPAASDRRENAPETNEDLHDFVPEQGELSRSSTIETTSTQQRPLVPEVPQEEYSANPHSPLLLSRERTTTSIDSLQPQQTGASTHSSISLSKPVIPVIPMQNHPREDVVVDSSDHIDNEPTHEPEPLETVDQNSIAAPESSEDEIDEEEQRKQQLRARMAKMSGGMGMGMHMALGIGGNNATRSTKPKSHTPTQDDFLLTHAAIPAQPDPHSSLLNSAATESEKEGYDADDDETG